MFGNFSLLCYAGPKLCNDECVVRISLKHMIAKTRDAAHGLDQDTSAHRQLLYDLEQLQGVAFAGVARAMALLWEDFVDTLGGPDVFRSASDEDRDAYVGKVRHIGEPYAAHPSKRLYALTASSMASYLELLARADLSDTDRQLCRVVASMIDRGRMAQSGRASGSDEAGSKEHTLDPDSEGDAVA
jgi:hypothetical protein